MPGGRKPFVSRARLNKANRPCRSGRAPAKVSSGPPVCLRAAAIFARFVNPLINAAASTGPRPNHAPPNERAVFPSASQSRKPAASCGSVAGPGESGMLAAELMHIKRWGAPGVVGRGVALFRYSLSCRPAGPKTVRLTHQLILDLVSNQAQRDTRPKRCKRRPNGHHIFSPKDKTEQLSRWAELKIEHATAREPNRFSAQQERWRDDKNESPIGIAALSLLVLSPGRVEWSRKWQFRSPRFPRLARRAERRSLGARPVAFRRTRAQMHPSVLRPTSEARVARPPARLALGQLASREIGQKARPLRPHTLNAGAGDKPRAICERERILSSRWRWATMFPAGLSRAARSFTRPGGGSSSWPAGPAVAFAVAVV